MPLLYDEYLMHFGSAFLPLRRSNFGNNKLNSPLSVRRIIFKMSNEEESYLFGEHRGKDQQV